MTSTERDLDIKDHNELFDAPHYQEQFENKKQFETPCSPEEVASVRDWTRGQEYREKNFARQGLVVNPEKACQPLGAVLASAGFERTLPLVHGSQGCVAYFRTHFSRHFREPVPAVSSSMTEDAAVFGGLNNMVDALENSTALYKPSMVAVSTTCMAEVIGDDLQNYIAKAREKEVIPDSLKVPYAHTPSFVGSHITGYDSMLRSILEYLTIGEPNEDAEVTERRSHQPNGRLNVVPGFDTYVGNLRELKRLLSLMGVRYTLLGDHSETLDSPATGAYDMYPGGTPLAEAEDAANAVATILLQESATRQTAKMMRAKWEHEVVTLPMPIGVANTDRFVTEVARLTGVAVPEAVTAERGRLVDAMTDSYAYLHGKRVALAGDPDLVVSLLGFLTEVGAEPVHVVCTNGDDAFEQRAKAVLASTPFGSKATVWRGKDLWHMRSLVFTEPVDLLVGSSHLKYLSKEAGVPLVRVGFPIFDRHHLHRFPIVGYQGGINLLSSVVNTVLDELDRTAPDHSFDLIR
ncbi:MAG: nitrogenase molybdenum-iron protein subunit beta [Actinomycetota bacterium]|nr:nitrogenase molybdenum-iron protein subunit beta [Actinomycetota bacterium]